MTTFKHTALVCHNEDHADRFYQDLLRLEKAEPWPVPPTLTKALFGLDAELTIINYTGAGMHFEIFIAPGHPVSTTKIEHTCIEVKSRREFLDTCQRLGIMVNQVPKGDRVLIFAQDFDGNLFEVKFRAN
ncbi:MAG: VOC family protein [Desulfobacterales bacterium]|nr:VOC family protein [Desulfobacterales bacterium]